MTTAADFSDRPVCNWVRLGRERHERDLIEGPARGLWFDEEAADNAVAFFGLCRFTKGREFAGKPFKLSVDQEWDMIRPLFGWKKLPDGMTPKQAKRIPLHDRPDHGIYRRFGTEYKEVPRKFGKTEIASGEALYCMSTDGEFGAEGYSAGTKRDQAMLAYRAIGRMVAQSPELLKRIQVGKSAITFRAVDGFFQPLSSDYNNLDGLDPHFVLADEVHKWREPQLWDVLDSARGARRQSLLSAITTAGDKAIGLCWELHQYAEKVLLGVIEDDAFFAYISTCDPGDNWRDPLSWAKANPNFPVTPTRDFLEKKLREALETPRLVNVFRRYYLNEWVGADKAWIDLEKWRACGEAFASDDLKGRPCYPGVDLSRRIDLTSCVLVFPPVESDPNWRILPWFWCPLDTINEKLKTDKVPYRTWADLGFIEPTPGGFVDYKYVLRFILGPAEQMFDVRKVCIDPYNATQFVTDIMGHYGRRSDEKVIMVRQGATSLNDACKEFEGLVKDGKIKHPNNPVMDWNVSNAVVVTDANENIRPAKDKSTGRIDGVSATVTAMAVALMEKPKRSGGRLVGFV